MNTYHGTREARWFPIEGRHGFGLSACLALLLSACITPEEVMRDPGDLAIQIKDEQTALDIAQWAMPVVSFFAQKAASLRDMGAQPNQVLFWSKPLDHNNKIFYQLISRHNFYLSCPRYRRLG